MKPGDAGLSCIPSDSILGCATKLGQGGSDVEIQNGNLVKETLAGNQPRPAGQPPALCDGLRFPAASTSPPSGASPSPSAATAPASSATTTSARASSTRDRGPSSVSERRGPRPPDRLCQRCHGSDVRADRGPCTLGHVKIYLDVVHMEARLTDPADRLGVGVYSLTEAARLLSLSGPNVPRNHLYTWAVGRPSRNQPPVFQRDIPPIRGHHALSFLDLIEFAFIRDFRKFGISLQAIRKAISTAAGYYKTAHHPLCLKQFATDGQTIFATISDELEGDEKVDQRSQYMVDLHACSL